MIRIACNESVLQDYISVYMNVVPGVIVIDALDFISMFLQENPFALITG